MLDGEPVGREVSPSAAVIGSQSVKTTEAGAPRGYDAGKKINGRKRHTMVDTDGRALKLLVHPASVQNRDGAIPSLKACRRGFPFVQLVFADSAYTADQFKEATCVAIKIVRKPPDQVGFEVHPRCGYGFAALPFGGAPAATVVERCFAWLNRNRCFAEDVEATIAFATAFLYAESAMMLIKWMARPHEFRDGHLAALTPSMLIRRTTRTRQLYRARR